MRVRELGEVGGGERVLKGVEGYGALAATSSCVETRGGSDGGGREEVRIKGVVGEEDLKPRRSTRRSG